MPREFITQDEAAEYLKVSPKTLEGLRCRGGGPQFHKAGRQVRYTYAALEAWLGPARSHTSEDLEAD